MEDERVGSIYLSMLKGKFAGAWRSLFPRGLSRSPFLPVLVLAVLILGPFIGWRLHEAGRFHTLKSEMKGDSSASLPQPGGMAPIELHAVKDPTSKGPQFLSATLLPGLGMSVLQITADLPGRGATPLLAAPSVQELVNGPPASPNGMNDDHGALELPWGGQLVGAITPMGTSLTVNWQAKQIEASTESSAHSGVAEGGMLWSESSDTANATPMDGGQAATATFRGINGEDHWPSKSDVVVHAGLTARALTLTIDAKNSGDEPEPMGIGWHPRFAMVGGARNAIQLELPGGQRLEMSDGGVPTGRMAAPGPPLERFIGHPGELGSGSMDETLVDLKGSGSAAGVEYQDTASGYGLRLIPLSSTIKAVRVSSPDDAKYVSLGFQTNLDDPLGHQWAARGGGGLVTLEPGQVLEWKVRLEIFALPQH